MNCDTFFNFLVAGWKIRLYSSLLHPLVWAKQTSVPVFSKLHKLVSIDYIYIEVYMPYFVSN